MSPARRIYPWADAQGVRELASHLAAGEFDLVHTHSAKAGAIGRMAARRVGVPAIVHSFHGFPFHEFQSPASEARLLAIERRLARDHGLLPHGRDGGRGRGGPAEDRPAGSHPRDRQPDRRRSARLRQQRAGAGAPRPRDPRGREGRRDSGPARRTEGAARHGRGDRRAAPARRVHGLDRRRGPARQDRAADRAARGLDDRFLLARRTDGRRTLLPAFDVFAMSSLYEGLPCAVVEAMTCGVPVVATAVNSVPEIVVSGQDRAPRPAGRPGSLSRALAYLLDHPEEAARMAAAAREHIGDRFRPEVLGRDLTRGLRHRARDSPARRRGGGELMRGFLDTAGERLAIECALAWVAELIAEGAAGELRRSSAADALRPGPRRGRPRHAFDTDGWQPLTRGAWRRDGEVVVENVCTAGFDLHLSCTGGARRLHLPLAPARARPRRRAHAALALPPARPRRADPVPGALVGRTRGAPRCTPPPAPPELATPLLTAPSGVGRSTLIARGARGGRRWPPATTSAVGDGDDRLGSRRAAAGRGRRRTAACRTAASEAPMRAAPRRSCPTALVVLERGRAERSRRSSPAAPTTAGAALVTSTYMAGELRRYWAFAATLAAGTGLGPGASAGRGRGVGVRRAAAVLLARARAGAPGRRLSDLLADLGRSRHERRAS